MEDNSCINRDYIGVIKETRNGFLEYQMVPVEQDEVFIKELEAIQRNNNRTLMDLQTKFTSRYPERIHSAVEPLSLYDKTARGEKPFAGLI